jgi:hypothetical protein
VLVEDARAFVEQLRTMSSSPVVYAEFARCPPGKKVIGGGVSVRGDQGTNAEDFVAVTRSRPIDSQMWEGQAHEHDTTTSTWTLTADALCAIVAS